LAEFGDPGWGKAAMLRAAMLKEEKGRRKK